MPGFGWLRSAPPSGWRVIAIPSGAAMAYPPGWRLVRGDAGTATAVRFSPTGRILGYLNLTPRQGAEKLSSWPAFRLAHNHDEGDRQIQRLAAATGLSFHTGHGSCVQAAYLTSVGSRYIELACLVTGRRTTAVIVGAAPPQQWPAMAPVIERAVAAVRA